VIKKQSHRARWVEGLDWIRVENILDPDFGGSPELYTALLKAMLDYLPDADPDLDDTVHAEAMRRIQAGEMSEEQVTCFAEALRLSAEQAGRLSTELEKLVKRGRLRLVK
jgi:hypothetical protein